MHLSVIFAHTVFGDKMTNSVWTDDLIIPTFPTLKHDLKTDVLIIGGGLAGILCAYKLKLEGVDCTLIEADRICNGVTRNTTAKLTAQHGCIYNKLLNRYGAETAKGYYEANNSALRELGRICSSVACDYESKDHYIFSTDSFLVLDREMRALTKLDIPFSFAEKTDLPFSVQGAIRFPDQAQFHPLKFVSAIVPGMRIYEHTAARQFVGNRVQTDHGMITAGKIIVATHFPICNKHGGYFLKMYQQRSYVTALKNTPPVNGMYLDAAENGLSFRSYGPFLLVGGGGHRTGKQGEGWRTAEELAKRCCPGSRECYRWATQDCMTLDGIPYIGQYGKHTPGMYVATGFNKWGMTSSMVSANILCDMVQGRKNPYADIFAPSRSMLHPQLLGNILETSVNLLTPTKPRCPHLGCALKWNPRERTWDCPCHGSRFSETGKLMDNPATDDLKQ